MATALDAFLLGHNASSVLCNRGLLLHGRSASSHSTMLRWSKGLAMISRRFGYYLWASLHDAIDAECLSRQIATYIVHKLTGNFHFVTDKACTPYSHRTRIIWKPVHIFFTIVCVDDLHPIRLFVVFRYMLCPLLPKCRNL